MQIQHYAIKIGRHRLGTWAALHVSSATTPDGGQDFATVFFGSSTTELSGNIQDHTPAGNNTVTVYAEMPMSDFDRMYEMLRHEAPVFLNYLADSSTSEWSAKLGTIYLSTDEQEVPGEGAADKDASLQFMRSKVEDFASDGN